MNRIRNSVRNGLALVSVDRDACGGCFNKIPPQRQLDIKCEEIKELNIRIDEIEDQKWKLHKIVGKYQQEVKQ